VIVAGLSDYDCASCRFAWSLAGWVYHAGELRHSGGPPSHHMPAIVLAMQVARPKDADKDKDKENSKT